MMNIKKYINKKFTTIGLGLLAMTSVFAGNDQRIGQAGATEILINPWAATSGWGRASMASVQGLESAWSNVAGLSRSDAKMEVGLSSTLWFADSYVNSLGLGFQMSEGSVLGVSLTSVSFGDILRTTVENPDPNENISFSFATTILGLQYSKKFTQSISGGLGIKMINEGMADMSASGFAIDMGVQYYAGDKDEFKFGIALKNVGSKMNFSGDGDDTRLIYESQEHPAFFQNFDARMRGFELPTQMELAASYDFYFAEDMHRVTPAFSFTSNAFGADILSLGAEYQYKSLLRLHAGFDYQSGITSDIGGGRNTALTGLAAGFEVMPFKSEALDKVSIAYSYRTANPLSGIHAFSLNFQF